MAKEKIVPEVLCPKCGDRAPIVKDHVRRHSIREQYGFRTHICDGSGAVVTPAMVAEWIAWQTDRLVNQAEYFARRLAAAQAEVKQMTETAASIAAERKAFDAWVAKRAAGGGL